MAGQILGLTIETWSALGSVVGGVGGSAAFLALAIDARGRNRARRLASPELMPLLLDARNDLYDVVSSGGKPWAWFLDPGRQRRGDELGAWRLMVIDPHLRQHLTDIIDAQKAAGAWARDSSTGPDVQQQTDAAREGVSHVEKALTRIGWLSRKYG